MAQGRSRPAWAEIDLAAVAHNAAVLARLAAPAELCAVVKAHGYGHGGPAVARAALAGGAGRLAVALVDEGVELREHGVTAPVLLLSECDPAAAATALSFGLTPRCTRAEGIAAFARGRRRGRPPGRRPRQGRHRHAPGRRGARGPARHRGRRGGRAVVGARGHLDPPAGGRRRARRTAPTRRASSTSSTAWWPTGRGRHPAPLLHAANTAGAIAFPRARHDMVRCGLGLYGYLPGRSGPGRLRRAGRRRAAAPGHGAQGAGGGRAHARRRGSAPPTAACVRCRRARSWPRSPSATPTACPAASSTGATRCSSAACAGPWPGR